MTMNLRFGLADDGLNKWDLRQRLVKKVLKRYPVDFLGIQEVNHFQAEFLDTALYDHEFIGWHNKSIDWWQSNLLFFSQSWTCIKCSHYFLSHTPGETSKLEGSKWPRQCVIGLFKKGVREIIAVNTHFDFTPGVQAESAKLIIGFLSEFPKDLPTIITGDFNCNPGSSAYRVFLKNGFKEIFEGQKITTFHDFEGRNTGRHIDWILYRNGIVPVSLNVVKDSFSNWFPSDHYPIQARFKWRCHEV